MSDDDTYHKLVSSADFFFLIPVCHTVLGIHKSGKNSHSNGEKSVMGIFIEGDEKGPQH